MFIKRVLLTSVLGMVMTIVGAVAVTPTALDKKTVSSKAYVDTEVETKQIKIPAAGQPNVDAGETVITYTAAGNGTIGERALYSDASSYNPSADGDKLITASALNATFTNLPTTNTTKLECANPGTCNLWTIVDQTAYGKYSKNLLSYNGEQLPYDDAGVLITRNNNIYNISVSEDKVGYPFVRICELNGLKAGSYYLSGTGNFPGGMGLRIVNRQVSPVVILAYGVGPFTIAEDINNKLSVEIWMTASQVNVGDYYITEVQLERGSTATPYEPYY